MNTEDRIKKAHVAIMGHKLWCAYSGVLACGKVEVTETIPTACTNGWDVKYNPAFIEEHIPKDPELRFLVLHEATHKAYRHMQVWKALHNEDAQLANVAADHFVNLALQDGDKGEGFIVMPKCGIQPEAKYRGWSVDKIFEDLKQNPPPQDKRGGKSGGGMDDHDFEGGAGTPEEIEAQAQEIQRAVRQGEMIRKRRAQGSANQNGVFGDLLAPQLDWRKLLRDFITETCKGQDESTWSRPNRRYLCEDIYMPSSVGTTMKELVVGFDTSGSIFGSTDMDKFVAEVSAIVQDVKPGKVHVIYWDTSVVGHQMFEDGQFAVQNLKPKGGGGTNGAVLFDYLREKNINPDAIVQFTDGEVGSWGRSSVPTLWAVTTTHTAPFGTTVHI